MNAWNTLFPSPVDNGSLTVHEWCTIRPYQLHDTILGIVEPELRNIGLAQAGQLPKARRDCGMVRELSYVTRPEPRSRVFRPRYPLLYPVFYSVQV